MTGRKTDKIWDQFIEKKGEKCLRALCKKCGKDIRGLVARMKSHFEQCKSEDYQNDDANLEDETISSSPVCDPSTSSLPDKRATSPSHIVTKKSKTDFPKFFYKTTTYEKQKLDIQVARYIFATNSAFRCVEHKEFKALCESLRPGYKPPDRKLIANDLLETIYKNESQKAIELLAGKVVCLAIDGWSNVHNEPIICASVTTFEGEIYLVDTIDTSGHQHDGEYLTLLMDTVNKVEDTFKCLIGSVVTDNAANMSVMRRNIEQLIMENASNNRCIITYGCSAHMLNLLAHDLEISSVTGHIVKVTKYFRNNHFARAKFNEAKTSNLVMPQEVRWNTMCECLERYVQNWVTLLDICENFKENIDHEIRAIISNIAIKRNAEDLLTILKPISIALDEIQSNTCHLADAVVIWKQLEEKLDVLCSEKRKLFRKRYKKALTPAHFAAYIITPKYALNKSPPIVLSTEEKEIALNFLAENFGTEGQLLLPKLVKFQLQSDPFCGSLILDSMVDQLNAVEWWSAVQKMKEYLSNNQMHIILQFLCTTASSAGIERVFSTYGFVQSKLRNQLGTEKASKLVFLYKLLNTH